MRLHPQPALNAALLRLSAATLARLAARSGRNADEAGLTQALERSASLREAYEAACPPKLLDIAPAAAPAEPEPLPVPQSDLLPEPLPKPVVVISVDVNPEPPSVVAPAEPIAPPELPERHFLDGPSLIGLPQEPQDVTQSSKRPGRRRGLLWRR